jgi:hypothetical protein
MKNIFNFVDFINEELTKLPTTYKFTKSEKEDKEHNRLASKKKDGHAWKKAGSKKEGKASMTQNFTCKCGYKKIVVNNEGKDIVVTYSK